jgi:hypothetical protein
VPATAHRLLVAVCAAAPGFDLVLMLDVPERLPDPVGVLRKAAELLESGGRLLITVPAFQMLWTVHDDLNRHFVGYNRRATKLPPGLRGLGGSRSVTSSAGCSP